MLYPRRICLSQSSLTRIYDCSLFSVKLQPSMSVKCEITVSIIFSPHMIVNRE